MSERCRLGRLHPWNNPRSSAKRPFPPSLIRNDFAGPTSDLKHLDRSLVSSIAWTATAKWIVQTLSWASTLLVVRLLAPADYGIVGMAAAFLAFLQPFCDFGIAAAIVQGRQLSDEHIARLNGFAIGLGPGDRRRRGDIYRVAGVVLSAAPACRARVRNSAMKRKRWRSPRCRPASRLPRS